MILNLLLITQMTCMIFIKTLTPFDNMIADILNNKKINPTVTELFIRGRKLNISVVFIKSSYFAAPKSIRLNSTHHFIMQIINLIIHWILAWKILCIFTKNVLQDHIFFSY